MEKKFVVTKSQLLKRVGKSSKVRKATELTDEEREDLEDEFSDEAGDILDGGLTAICKKIKALSKNAKYKGLALDLDDIASLVAPDDIDLEDYLQ